MKTRRKYQCTKCRFQIAPTAGTIFEKSKIPLALWFHAIMVFSNAKSGISAKVIERDLEVTYKCAWRMLALIRGSLRQSEEELRGDVEVDTGYLGGKGKAGKNNERLGAVMKAKSVVFAAIQRKKAMRAKVAPDASALSHQRFVWNHVWTTGTRLMTDKANHFNRIAELYDRHAVNHSKREYARGDVHINSAENFWSHVKGSIRGTHKKVSSKHLQSYLDGFVFHANNRGNDKERFFSLLDGVLQHRVWS